MEINPNFGEDLSEMEWKTIRNTKKAMWRKYCKNKEEEDLKKYNNFVKLARAYWKLTMGEQVPICFNFKAVSFFKNVAGEVWAQQLPSISETIRY